jgi:hypothetical protein
MITFYCTHWLLLRGGISQNVSCDDYYLLIYRAPRLKFESLPIHPPELSSDFSRDT